MSDLNIFQKMTKATDDIQSVAKNLTVGIGTSQYKAVSEADVLKAVKPIEIKYGIYSYPFNREIIESGIIESVNKDGTIKKQLYERIEVTYRFVNIDNPSEFIDIKSYGDGIDSGDKSVGKAMTYADKYALLKAYKIQTGDDPDAHESEELSSAKTKKRNKPKANVTVASNNDADVTRHVLIAECNDYEVSLDKLATYLKKSVEELTNADLQFAINQKKKALEKGANKNE